MTFPSLYGLARSRELAAYWTEEAVDALRPFRERGETLRFLAEMILVRDH